MYILTKFLLHFLMHIDVLMLCRKFELIPTKKFQVMTIFKMGQFLFKVAQKSGQSPCTIVHGLGPNFMKND